MSGPVVILPWLGEFGWLLMRHSHYVHWYPSPRKVVCCAPGQECLFPSAAECFTDWQNPIPDSRRWEGTAWGDPGATDRFHAELRPRLESLYPGHEIHTPRYGCHWHMADGPGFAFRPTAAQRLPVVDVVLGARHRQFDGSRNWPHWNALGELLASQGLSLGVVGQSDTTVHVPDAIRAWDHPDGDTAGSVDLLSHCRLYVGVDSGMTHLAGILSVPTVLIEAYCSHHMIGPAERANKSLFRSVDPGHWGNPTAVAQRALSALAEADAFFARPAVTRETVGGDGLVGRVDGILRDVDQRSRTTLVVCDCSEEDLQALHTYRDRFVHIDCHRKGM